MGLRGHKTAVVSSGLAVRFLVALMGPTHVAFLPLGSRHCDSG